MQSRTSTVRLEDISFRRKGRKNIIFLITAKANVAYLDSRCTLRQGLEQIKRHGYTAMPVVAEDGTYVGTVSEGDFLRHLLSTGDASLKAQEKYLITEIVRRDWNSPIKVDTTLDDLLLRVMEQNFVPVVDDRDKFVGIITRRSVMKYYYDLLSEEVSEGSEPFVSS